MFIDRFVMHLSRDDTIRWVVGISGALTIALTLKTWILLSGLTPFNADEAIVALMARHILGGELPLFFYGQSYMGSLDAVLVAAGFLLFGSSIWVVRLVQVGLYAFMLLTTAFLSWRLSGRWIVGVMSGMILAIPTVNMGLYTTVSLGGYGEMLLIGNLILLLAIAITHRIKNRGDINLLWLWFALGFFSGFGIWVFGFTLVYSVSALVYLLWYWVRILEWDELKKTRSSWWKKRVRVLRKSGISTPVSYLGVTLLGGFCGSFPWWVKAQQAGIQNLFSELGGSAIAGVESLDHFGSLLQHVLNLSLFGSTVIFGMRPPWEIRWLALPLAPVALMVWVGVIIYAVRKVIKELKSSPDEPGYSHAPLLGLVILMVALGFILTPFGADPSGRYFLPVNVILAIFAGQAIWSWRHRVGNLAWAGLIGIIAFNFWGTLQVAEKNPPGMTTQFDAVTQIDHSHDDELINFLTAHGEMWGYTNYWVAYPMAFQSEESLIYLPRLPYHEDLRYTPRDDRYKPYRSIVDQAESIAYITTNNPVLDEQIRAGFVVLGVDWKEKMIGDYHVYYQISRVVRPEEIGLGEG